MRRSYLDYAMSVIVGRALPDIRDGLKPVIAVSFSECTSWVSLRTAPAQVRQVPAT